MTKFTFEGLEVYSRGRHLVKLVYERTSDFPPHEIYGLAHQLRRASISIVSNIAEGSARTGHKDKAHFFEMAYGSLMEVLCQLDVAVDLGYLDEAALASFRSKAELMAKQLSALRRSHLEAHGV